MKLFPNADLYLIVCHLFLVLNASSNAVEEQIEMSLCTQNLFCSWSLRRPLAFLFQMSRMFRHLIPVLRVLLVFVNALSGRLRPGLR